MTNEEALETLIDNAENGYVDIEEVKLVFAEMQSNSDVLDKIRAEIKALSNSNPSYWHSGDMIDRDDVLEIIDKYKGESEDKE